VLEDHHVALDPGRLKELSLEADHDRGGILDGVSDRDSHIDVAAWTFLTSRS
jgi:hypothetical protein